MRYLVTIIIVARDMEKHIEKTLNSILNQKYQDYELILIDDGSMDETFNIMQKYQVDKFVSKKVTVITQTASGVSIARNKALPLAKGQYIMFFDADDIMEPDYLEKMVSYITIDDVDMVIGDVVKISEDGDAISEPPKIYTKIQDGKYDTSYKVKDLMTLGDNVDGITGSKLYKSSIIFQNKLQFDNLQKCSDVTFFLEYLFFCSSVYIANDAVIKYRVSDGFVKSRASNKDLDIIECFKHVEAFVNNMIGAKKRSELFNYILQNMKIRELSFWTLHYTSPSASTRTLRKRLFKKFHREIINDGKKYFKYLSEDRKQEIKDAKKRYVLRWWYLSAPYRLYKRNQLRKKS